MRSGITRSPGFNPLPHGAHMQPVRASAGPQFAPTASIPYLTGHILQRLSRLRCPESASGFNPLPHGAHIATLHNQLRLVPGYPMLQSPTSRGTYCNGRGVAMELGVLTMLQSPTSRGTYCNPPAPPPRLRRTRFNPLPHGAHIATGRVQHGKVFRIASIPYLTGHILQRGRRAIDRAVVQHASIPYLTGHILQLVRRRQQRRDP